MPKRGQNGPLGPNIQEHWHGCKLRQRYKTRHTSRVVDENRRAGDVIRTRWEDLGFSQQSLARTAGVGISSVKRLAKGARLRPQTERKIAAAIDWTRSSIDAVFNEEEASTSPKQSSETSKDLDLTPDEIFEMKPGRLVTAAKLVERAMGVQAAYDLVIRVLRLQSEAAEARKESEDPNEDLQRDAG